MAGILANSASHTMVGGDTSANDVESGYITGEQIVLGANPTGTTYSWGQSLPVGSTPARSALSSSSSAAPTFTPDVAGEYVITCTVDGVTSYVIRLSVEAVTPAIATGAFRLLPRTNASVPTPTTGATLFYSSDEDAVCVKDTGGDVSTVDLTAT